MNQTTGTDDGKSKRKLRYVVCFKIKDGASMAQASCMVHEFPALEEISQIHGLKFGSNSIFAKINNGSRTALLLPLGVKKTTNLTHASVTQEVPGDLEADPGRGVCV
jgi:hypothetical protein